MDNPYQNPAAAAAILAMHQAPPSHGSHNPQQYNYLQAQEQLHPSSITHASNQYGALHPSLPHLPIAQDYVTAAARRLNEQIYASRNAVDDSIKGKILSIYILRHIIITFDQILEISVSKLILSFQPQDLRTN